MLTSTEKIFLAEHHNLHSKVLQNAKLKVKHIAQY